MISTTVFHNTKEIRLDMDLDDWYELRACLESIIEEDIEQAKQNAISWIETLNRGRTKTEIKEV